MATHSSISAWKISRTEEPGGRQSTGHRVGQDRAHSCAFSKCALKMVPAGTEKGWIFLTELTDQLTTNLSAWNLDFRHLKRHSLGSFSLMSHQPRDCGWCLISHAAKMILKVGSAFFAAASTVLGTFKWTSHWQDSWRSEHSEVGAITSDDLSFPLCSPPWIVSLRFLEKYHCATSSPLLRSAHLFTASHSPRCLCHGDLQLTRSRDLKTKGWSLTGSISSISQPDV